MSSIFVFCAGCGRQVPSPETADRLCVDCRVTRSLEPLRREHTRLWRKRERYRISGANLESLERQMHRIEQRMGERVRDLVSNDERAAEIFVREIKSLRTAHYDLGR